MTIIMIVSVIMFMVISMAVITNISKKTLSVEPTLDSVFRNIEFGHYSEDQLGLYFSGGVYLYPEETLSEVFGERGTAFNYRQISFSCKILDERQDKDTCYADIELRATIEGKLVKKEVDGIVFVRDENIWLLEGTYILDEMAQLIDGYI